MQTLHFLMGFTRNKLSISKYRLMVFSQFLSSNISEMITIPLVNYPEEQGKNRKDLGEGICIRKNKY